jgi:hypothetical protein
MINKLCYLFNLIYFYLLSYLMLNKLNENPNPLGDLNEISWINSKGY